MGRSCSGIASKYKHEGKIKRFADEETSERFLGRVTTNLFFGVDNRPIDGPDAGDRWGDNYMDYYRFYPYEQIDFDGFLQDF